MARFPLVVLVFVLIVPTAIGAVKPKPYQWTPAKAGTRLLASAPFVWSEDVHLMTSTCLGTGKAAAGRYSRFACRISFGGTNVVPYKATVVAKVLPVGTGKLCIPVGSDGMAVTSTGSSAGVRVATGKSCP